MSAALTRYRVMAYLVGLLLLVVFSGPPLRWFSPEGSTAWEIGEFTLNTVSPVHGFLYLVFLVATAMLAREARWSIGFTLQTMLLGTVPFASFWGERRATARTRARIAAHHPDGIGRGAD